MPDDLGGGIVTGDGTGCGLAGCRWPGAARGVGRPGLPVGRGSSCGRPDAGAGCQPGAGCRRGGHRPHRDWVFGLCAVAAPRWRGPVVAGVQTRKSPPS